MNSKIKMFSAVFSMAVVFAMSSCSKRYTCECTTNDGHVSTSEIAEPKREDAEAECEEMEYDHTTTLNNQTFTSTNTCELK